MPEVDRHGFYRGVLLAAAPRLLSLLDRERASPTRGSFDRVHWAWKFRDFPLTMWQASMMPLASLYRTDLEGNRYRASSRLAEWLAGALESTFDRQHRNGAFDSFTPYSQDHGVTLAMVLTIATTIDSLGTALPATLRERARDCVRRACLFASRSDEDYAFISNHQAAFALAWWRAGRLLDDAQLVARSDAVVASILRHQSNDGWLAEYGGPDPGYETFSLTYLALLQQERPSARLLEALRRSVHFLSHCVHPDGSIGGNYGSRHTAQFAPGGLELLAPQLPLAGAIASFVVGRAGRGNLVTPLTCDDDNLALLTFSYSVACTAPTEPAADTPPLPCQQDRVLTRFDDSGILAAGTQCYYAVTNLKKGGVVRVFDRRSGEVAYEDSGILLRTAGGDWVSHLASDASRSEETAPGLYLAEAPFSAVKYEILTPFKFLILRILNLTLFRSVVLGAAVRRMIIARLITSRRTGPWTLRRTLAFDADGVRIEDQVIPGDEVAVTSASIERSLLALHMGSARYFHANELRDLGEASLASWCSKLSQGRSCTLRQEIEFTEVTSTIRRQVLLGRPAQAMREMGAE